MNLDLSPLEIEELKELVESSINKITLELNHTRNPQKKIELKEQRDELIEILSKIDSRMGQQAA